ncbi:MAG TPA: PspC domain-containing protein [Thermoanaerobaculia bacterium]|nr:PspC domain-containing protein [Thermoanaerobaculia bacterium]
MALYRSREHRILAGVCGGFADWLGWNPTLVRIAFVILSIFPGAGIPGIIVYLVLWMLMPKAPRHAYLTT